MVTVVGTAKRLLAALTAMTAVVFALGIPATADTDDALPMGPALTSTIETVAPAMLTPTTSLSVRVMATAGMAPVSGVRATLAVTSSPLTTTEQVDAFLEAPQLAPRREVAAADMRAFDTGRPRAVGALGAGQASAMGLLADPTALALPRGTSGVYGVVVTTTGVDVTPITQGFVIAWSDSSLPTLDVAVIATVGGSPQRAAALFSAASDPRVALLADPTALATMEGGRPGTSGRELYALPAGHVDIASLVHGGAGGVLDIALTQAQANVDSGVGWIAVPATVDQGIVDAVYERGAVALLTGPRTGAGAPVTSEPVAQYLTTSGDTLPVVMADARLSTVLGAPNPDKATQPARLVAEAALRAASGTGPRAGTVVISSGDSWVVDGTRPSAAIEALFAAPWVKPVGIGTVLSLPNRATLEPPAEPVTEGDVAPADLVTIKELLGRVHDVAVATESPDRILNGEARSLLAAISLPVRADQDVRSSALDAAVSQASTVVNAVSVTSSSELTLVSSSGNVPITVRNDLPVAVTVRVVMTSRSPSLLIDSQPLVTIPAGVEQTVLVPITGVRTDDVKVTVALRNEPGATLAVAKTLEVRVRAEWGNTATGVVTAGLVLLMIAGVWRTIRRGRRDTRLPPSVDPDVASPAKESRP